MQYPTDPFDALTQIEDFFNQGHDVKHLVLGLYELVGFGLGMWVGAPTPDAAKLSTACQRCTVAMAQAQQSSLPSWLKPIAVAIIQSILTYLQGSVAQQHFATKTP